MYTAVRIPQRKPIHEDYILGTSTRSVQYIVGMYYVAGNSSGIYCNGALISHSVVDPPEQGNVLVEKGATRPGLWRLGRFALPRRISGVDYVRAYLPKLMRTLY